jgi:hypothetical protein
VAVECGGGNEEEDGGNTKEYEKMDGYCDHYYGFQDKKNKLPVWFWWCTTVVMRRRRHGYRWKLMNEKEMVRLKRFLV